jgi:hypothetical protein
MFKELSFWLGGKKISICQVAISFMKAEKAGYLIICFNITNYSKTQWLKITPYYFS